jgi:putative tryptophan/tyrosine transport system substrate-binding protein
VQILMVVLVAVVGVVSPIAAQHGKIHRVAILLPFATEEAKPYREAFFEGMRELGYVDGRNVVFDVRTSDRDRRNVPSLVMELIAVNPDVLVSDANAIHAIRAKTTSIPIVLAVAGDPVRDGYASSLRRPGLNVTGSAIPFEALAAKHVEIMREIRPRLARVALLFDTTNDRCTPFEQGAQSAARQIGAAFSSYRVASRDAIERAFATMESDHPDLLLPCPTAMLFNNRDLLLDSAVRLRIPFTSFVVANLPHGVLFSYAPSFAAGYRRAAIYTDKILKGAKPGDLPIEEPTTFDFVVNLKTARTLGVVIPPSVMLRANRVIE